MFDRTNAPSVEENHPPAAAATTSLLGRFTVILGAVREPWIVFAYVVMSNLAYMLVVLTLSL